MSDTPRGLKLSCCGNHPERTDLSCYKIRRLDGTALTVAELWAELTAAHAEIAELRAKCERLEKVATNAALRSIGVPLKKSATKTAAPPSQQGRLRLR